MKKQTFNLGNGKVVEQPKSKVLLITIIILICTLISVKMTGFSFIVLFERGAKFFDLLIDMFPPNFSYLSEIWKPLMDTVKMSIIGSFVGSILAIPVAIISASNIVKNKFVTFAARLFLGVTRTLPTLVIALVATFIFDLGTFAGTVAITIFTFSYIGKLLYEQIETVNMGAYEAMEAMGTTKIRAFWNGIAPQILPGYIANCLFCFEGNVRYSAILGYVGAGGIGLILNENIAWREYDKVGMILLALFATVVVIEVISHAIRKKLM